MVGVLAQTCVLQRLFVCCTVKSDYEIGGGKKKVFKVLSR